MKEVNRRIQAARGARLARFLERPPHDSRKLSGIARNKIQDLQLHLKKIE